MKIKDIDKAVDRIKEAVQNEEKIVIYGDADVDGVSSVIIMEETIKAIGGKVERSYFPDYEKQRHGVNEVALNILKPLAPALLITVDLGISNNQEIEIAKEMGFDVVIIDHHDIIDKIPEATAVVDPKREDDNYPFKFFAAAGLVLRVAEDLIDDMSKSLREDLVSLAAVATITDMMPQEDENLEIIEEGLKYLDYNERPGIKVFFQSKKLGEGLSSQEVVSKISTLTNVRNIEGDYPAAYLMLSYKTMREAEEFLDELIEKNELRQNRINEGVAMLEEKLLNNPTEEIIFEGHSSWDSSILSSIASRISAKFLKPAFLFPLGEDEIRGTMRCPRGINGMEALKSCDNLLIMYGGHPPAGGYRIKKENLSKFKECLTNYFLSIKIK
jgi:single-stranded-DNA-specific exonuclease